MEWKLKSHNVNSTTQIQEVCTTALHCMHKDNTLAMHAEFGVIHFVLPWCVQQEGNCLVTIHRKNY